MFIFKFPLHRIGTYSISNEYMVSDKNFHDMRMYHKYNALTIWEINGECIGKVKYGPESRDLDPELATFLILKADRF
jgi:hypothetical protein